MSSTLYQLHSSAAKNNPSSIIHRHSWTRNTKDERQRATSPTQPNSPIEPDTPPFCTTAYLLPSRLTHTRFKPAFHRWEFAHFLCGIPVNAVDDEDPKAAPGKAITTSMISIDDLPPSQRNLFRVEADDHLDHCPEPTTLRKKLDKCLVSKGVKPSTFPKCYLVTPPRFLEFPLFNPVTFWFLYLEDGKFGALMVEVHNSAQERRNYLLHDGLEGAGLDGEDCPPTAVRRELPNYVEFTCDKVFHASAFSSRSGIYSTRVMDPMAEGNHGGCVDATITLKAEEGPSSLVARVVSCGLPIDPRGESWWAKLLLVCQCTSTMITMFPKAMLQMYILRFRRKLQIHDAPVPLPGTVAKPSTDEEIFIEGIFRRFLVHQIEALSTAVTLNYESPEATKINPDRVRDISSAPESNDKGRQTGFLQVLTPLFYSNIVRYGSLRDAVESEIVDAKYSSGTIRVQDMELMELILETSESQTAKTPANSTWRALVMRQVAKLRSPAATGSQSNSLDEFVVTNCDSVEMDKYMWITFRSLVDERSIVGLIRIKLWSLVAIITLGLILSTISMLHGDLHTVNLTGSCLAIAGVILWIFTVSKEDLAKFLII